MELQTTLLELYVEKLNAEPQAGESIIAEAMNDPQLFVFDEILRHPAVAGLNSVKVQQLRTMSLGVWRDCRDSIDKQLALKMRKLSILSKIRNRGWTNIPLHALADSIDFEASDGVIELLIEMRREGLISFRIDERLGLVNVTDVMVHRDVDLADIPQLEDDLQQVISHLKNVLMSAQA